MAAAQESTSRPIDQYLKESSYRPSDQVKKDTVTIPFKHDCKTEEEYIAKFGNPYRPPTISLGADNPETKTGELQHVSRGNIMMQTEFVNSQKQKQNEALESADMQELADAVAAEKKSAENAKEEVANWYVKPGTPPQAAEFEPPEVKGELPYALLYVIAPYCHNNFYVDKASIENPIKLRGVPVAGQLCLFEERFATFEEANDFATGYMKKHPNYAITILKAGDAYPLPPFECYADRSKQPTLSKNEIAKLENKTRSAHYDEQIANQKYAKLTIATRNVSLAIMAAREKKRAEMEARTLEARNNADEKPEQAEQARLSQKRSSDGGDSTSSVKSACIDA